jgi:hypothetical protein
MSRFLRRLPAAAGLILLLAAGGAPVAWPETPARPTTAPRTADGTQHRPFIGRNDDMPDGFGLAPSGS